MVLGAIALFLFFLSVHAELFGSKGVCLAARSYIQVPCVLKGAGPGLFWGWCAIGVCIAVGVHASRAIVGICFRKMRSFVARNCRAYRPVFATYSELVVFCRGARRWVGGFARTSATATGFISSLRSG